MRSVSRFQLPPISTRIARNSADDHGPHTAHAFDRRLAEQGFGEEGRVHLRDDELDEDEVRDDDDDDRQQRQRRTAAACPASRLFRHFGDVEAAALGVLADDDVGSSGMPSACSAIALAGRPRLRRPPCSAMRGRDDHDRCRR